VSEGRLIDVSANLIAVSWTTNGGAFGVFRADEFRKCLSSEPLVRGHTGKVVDLKFCPFKSNLIASSSEDNTVKIWEIPEKITEDLTAELQVYSMLEKASISEWNPNVLEIIATAGNNGNLHLWNISDGQSIVKHNFEKSISSINWDFNGASIVVSTKDKKMHVYDPRSDNVTCENKPHLGSKSTKSGFADDNYIYSFGFSQSNTRELKLFDIRNFEEVAQTVQVDSQSGILNPYYDTDTGIIYACGRGDSTIKYFEFNSGKLNYINAFNSNTLQRSVAFFPKRTLNYNKSEVAKAAKLTNNSIEFISFTVPKKNEGFYEDLYCPVLTGVSNNTVEKWIGGENILPQRESILNINPELFEQLQLNIKKTEKVEQPTKKDNVDELNAIIESLKSEKEALIREIEDFKCHTDQLEKTIQDKDKAYCESLLTNDCLNSELNSLKSALTNLMEEYNVLRAKCESSTSNI